MDWNVELGARIDVLRIVEVYRTFLVNITKVDKGLFNGQFALENINFNCNN